MHGVPPHRDGPFNVGGLVANRMKPVGVGIPATDMRHSDQACPQHDRALYADIAPGTTTGPVSSTDHERVA